MKLHFVCEPLPPDPKWAWSPRSYFRGTDESAVRTAECAAALGHEVTVVYDGEDDVVNGVSWRHRRPENELREAHDVTNIYVNHHPSCSLVSSEATNVFWSNLYGERFDPQGRHAHYDRIILISEYQRSMFASPRADGTYGPKIQVVGLGTDVERYASSPGSGKAPIACFTSSPDRGLKFLREMWPRVKAATGYDLVSPAESGRTFTETEMAELYRSSKFWLHPGLGIELFCLAGLKAQVAGCIPVVVPHMALGETIHGGVRTTLARFESDLIEAIRHPPGAPPVPADGWPTWEGQTRKFLEAVKVFG